MDELRLLEPAGGASAAHPAVAIKMVSSISPVDGNNPPSPWRRWIPATAELADYQVYAASNQTGMDTIWSKEYDFDRAYHEPAFTAATVAPCNRRLLRRSQRAAAGQPELSAQLLCRRQVRTAETLLAGICVRAEESHIGKLPFLRLRPQTLYLHSSVHRKLNRQSVRRWRECEREAGAKRAFHRSAGAGHGGRATAVDSHAGAGPQASRDRGSG